MRQGLLSVSLGRCAALLLISFIASTTPATAFAAPDPARPGPFKTKRFQIFSGWESVDVGYQFGVEDLAEVTIPVGRAGRIARGTHPVVLLLHGRHAWCSMTGDIQPPTPTPNWCFGMGNIPVPSFQGYRYLADRLASQGRAVVSISANGINAQDQDDDYGATPRGRLVQHHLSRLVRANRGIDPDYRRRLAGHLRLSDVVLMGHSRGGEGVVRAAQLISRPEDEAYRLAGVVPFAPVTFSRSAPPVVATTTLLPACDGDVSDQQGQTLLDRGRDLYGDRGRLRSSVWIPGANHNYLNTEWTPGLSVSETGSDDSQSAYSPDPSSGRCQDSLRLTPAQERTVGLEYLAAAVRYAQDGNRSVTGLLDGSRVRPTGVRKAGIGVRTSSLSGPDRQLLVPSDSRAIRASGMSSALHCQGVEFVGDPSISDACGREVVGPYSGNDTAWLASTFWMGDPSLPGRVAMEGTWSGGPASALMDLRRPRDLSDSRRISARVVVDPSTSGSVRLAVRDSRGRVARASLVGATAEPMTSSGTDLRLWPQTIAARPRDFSGVDLRNVASVGFSVNGSGRAWLIDASVRDRRSAPAAAPLPAIELSSQTKTVQPGPQSATVPFVVDFDRRLRAPARFRIRHGQGAQFPGGLLTVTAPAGARRVTVPIPITPGDPVQPEGVSVAAYALSGATVGMFQAMLAIDGSASGGSVPAVKVANPVVSTEPGGTFSWTLRSTKPLGDLRVSMASAESDLARSDYAGGFRQRVDAAGGFVVSTSRISGNLYRIEVPLSSSAQPGQMLDLRVESITGAHLRAFDGLRGVVVAP